MHSNKILLNMYHAYDGTSILQSPLCLHFHGCNIKGVCTVLQRSIIHNMYDGTIKAIRELAATWRDLIIEVPLYVAKNISLCSLATYHNSIILVMLVNLSKNLLKTSIKHCEK